MSTVSANLQNVLEQLPPEVKLVAVSKFKPLSAILEAYAEGQRAFGESRAQEFAAKAVQLPQDIEWHFIGHLQTNKLKLVLPYASMVESVDSEHLLEAIDSWVEQATDAGRWEPGRKVRVLLEVHIGAEESKSGFTPEEVRAMLAGACPPEPAISIGGRYPNVEVCGLMGMASNTDDEDVIAADFARIKALFDECRALLAASAQPGSSSLAQPGSSATAADRFCELSIGMSGDWSIAVQHGATIVRIGTAIFGSR